MFLIGFDVKTSGCRWGVVQTFGNLLSHLPKVHAAEAEPAVPCSLFPGERGKASMGTQFQCGRAEYLWTSDSFGFPFPRLWHQDGKVCYRGVVGWN